MERAELSHVLRAWRSQGTGAKYQGPRLITETDPLRFMSAFADAVAGDSEVFLCDPNWGTTEKAQLEAMLKSKIENQESKINRGWLMIPTGGTSGKLKFARHDQDTIMTAVVGFCRHYGLVGVDAVGVLPLHHVSGFMAWLRCALAGGEYRPLDWKAVEEGTLPELPAKADGWIISLVPTQLERLLRQPVTTAWLIKFRIVLLGGAAAGDDLLARASAARIPLSPGYGMTETAAMVAALRPEEFMAGERGSGEVLPHARMTIAPDGIITVGGSSLFRGYYPEWREPGDFETTDLGRWDEKRQLHVIGRSDDLIISGGEKVRPAEVEQLLRETGQFTEVVVVGLDDQEWGKVVVAAYPAAHRPDLEQVRRLLVGRMSAWKRPKHFVPLSAWPFTSAGKVNRREVARLVVEARG